VQSRTTLASEFTCSTQKHAIHPETTNKQVYKLYVFIKGVLPSLAFSFHQSSIFFTILTSLIVITSSDSLHFFLIRKNSSMKDQKLINTINKIKHGFKDSHTNVAHIQTRFSKVILTFKKRKENVYYVWIFRPNQLTKARMKVRA
jgi:hypothetical protein